MDLVLEAVDVAGPCQWRWLLLDGHSGVPLADHVVELNPGLAETAAFEDLYRFVRWRAEPQRRAASEAELVRRVGTWIGSVALGKRISQAIATAAPVTVRVKVPAGAEFLAARPWELARVGSVPLAARGDVAVVYDLPSRVVSKAPIGASLRILGVFSLPTANVAAGLRRERFELSRLIRRVALRGRRRVELKVAQYGTTRTVLRDLVECEDGWDVVHLAGYDGAGYFLLQKADGSVDPLPTAELIRMLRPLQRRVKLVVISACRSALVTTAETLCLLGLPDLVADWEVPAVPESAVTSIDLARALTTELGCAVVAMRYPVADDFAVGFAGALYDRTFRNVQRLDRAVAAAVPDAAGPVPTLDRPAISVTTPAILGASAIKLFLDPPVGKPVNDPTDETMTWFPPESPRFVGRAELMAAASAALAPASGRTLVVLHGMAGAGKTACAVELAYRHRSAFTTLAFWAAPSDPDQLGDALQLLAMGLEAQLEDYRFAMADQIGTAERLERFLPTLAATLAGTRLLLILDNLDILLTRDGQWRDVRWAPLIGTLTGHGGPSRVILTSRIVPAGLAADTVLVQLVHALSRDESLLLARELPNLRAILHPQPVQRGPGVANPALGRRMLTLVQGHPKLLELADAAAADPGSLPAQLAAVEAAVGKAAVGKAAGEATAEDRIAVDEAALEAFFTEGETRLDAEHFRQILTAWITKAAAALSAPVQLLLQALCRIEETDRNTAILRGNRAALWRRLDQLGEPLPLGTWAAPLVDAALVDAVPVGAVPVGADPIDDPADSHGPVYYRIHSSVTEVIQAATPEPVIAAIDAQLAAWWTAVGEWAIEQQGDGKDTRQLVLRASLAAARYLLRQRDWDAASCLLERALIRESYAPATALVVIPSLRRIAEATGVLKDIVILAAALRKVDSAEAETLLRRAYEQATTGGDYRLASTTAGDLVTLLRDQGRLREALTLAHRKIELTHQAGFGLWTQLSDQGRRLQILSMLGHHEQVLTELPVLRARMEDLPDQPADNDRVNPGHVREGILDVGRCSAVALQQWADALNLNDEIALIKKLRGAHPYEIACIRFNDYLPLLRLGRLAEVDQLLRECQDVFSTAGDVSQLAVVYGARADLADKRDHPQEAVELQRTSLRLRYLRPDPREVSTAHRKLADYLSAGSGNPAEQRAHRLTESLLSHLIGDTRELTRTLGVLATELLGASKHSSDSSDSSDTRDTRDTRGTRDSSVAQADSSDPNVIVLPTTLAEITQLVDADDGVHFGDLIVGMCPHPDTAEHALADLLTAAATPAHQQAHRTLDTAQVLAAWGPIITAVGEAATSGDTPAELAILLEDIATTDWAALVGALRRVLAGNRHREQLLAGLDTISAAILIAALDQLSPHSE